MTIHREGYKTIAITALIFGLFNLVSFTFLSEWLPWLAMLLFVVTLFLFLFIISFFRIPNRVLTINDDQIIFGTQAFVGARESRSFRELISHTVNDD